MKLKYILLPALFLIVLNSCLDTDVLGDKCVARTVFVYMVASNLGSNLGGNIADMTAVATPENLNGGNLVVFYSKNKEEAELFEIKEGANGVITRHHIRDYENKSAISPQVMKEILTEVVAFYPADSYGMILSSHGSAWLPAGFNDMLRSFGEEDRKYMAIDELASALPDHFFDFLLFDACSMGSIECVYELRNKADYIISSPSEIIDVGFPYQKILPLLFQNTPGLTQIADEFHNFYSNYSYPYGNISIVSTGELEALAGVTRTIISAAGGEEATFNFPSLFPDLQILTYYSAPTSLYDFGDVIRRLATDEQYGLFQASLDNVVAEKRTTASTYTIQGGREDNVIPVNVYSGLSVYPVQEELAELNGWYRKLDWYKAVYE
ncbi:MAG: hypothetical protein LBU37_08005 [Tannerellaceae bacterium]|jgi:hypothetical protein|nr:hypothetical protein [Tannerellaceae bacterium]